MTQRTRLVILILVTVTILLNVVVLRQASEIQNLELSLAWEERRIPLCSEDVVLVGAGDYEAGQYQAYECGPALDDYEREAR